MFSGSGIEWKNSQYCDTKVEGAGSGKYKMATYNTELHISAASLDSNVISTAIAMFSGSDIPMGQVSTFYNQNGRNRKWKLQDGGPYHCNAYISALRLDCNATTTAIPMIFGVELLNRTSVNTV